MLRKLIIKRTMSPILFKKRTLVCKQDHDKELSIVINKLILLIIFFFFIFLE
jgi:hypothetical protein